MIDPQTERFYTTRAEEWAAHLPHTVSPQIDAFLERLPAGAKILDLGCGDGRDAAEMERRGFDVDATDGVVKMVELASKRLKRPARRMEFSELSAREQYDGVWAHASLLHVPADELPAILRRVHAALKPGGWHFACYKGGKGGNRDPFGRFFSYIPEAELRAAYASAGEWSDFDFGEEAGNSYGNIPTTWYNITARKPA